MNQTQAAQRTDLTKTAETINFNWKTIVGTIIETAKPMLMDIISQEIDKLIASLKEN